MTEEEAVENQVGFIRGPEISFSGQSGQYTHTTLKVDSPFVEGYILSKFENRLLYGGDNSAFPEVDTWICRCDYVGKSAPRHNEKVGMATLRKAQELGGEGFGIDCARCALRLFGQPDGDGKAAPSECGSRQALMFLDDRWPDKALPLNIKGKSLSPLWAFLKSEHFQNDKGDLLPSMCRRVRLGSEKQKVGSKTFYVVTYTALEMQTELSAFQQMRKDGMELLRTAAKAAMLVPRPSSLAALPAPKPSVPSNAEWEDVEDINAKFNDAIQMEDVPF